MPRVYAQRQACRCHVQLQENHEPLFFLVGLAIIVFAFGGTEQKNRDSSRHLEFFVAMATFAISRLSQLFAIFRGIWDSRGKSGICSNSGICGYCTATPESYLILNPAFSKTDLFSGFFIATLVIQLYSSIPLLRPARMQS